MIQARLMDLIGKRFPQREHICGEPFVYDTGGGFLIRRNCKRLQHTFLKTPETSLKNYLASGYFDHSCRIISLILTICAKENPKTR